MPWKPEMGASGSVPRPKNAATGEEQKLQEVLQTLKDAYPEEASPPQAVADMLTKLEEDTGRQLTRSLHSATAQLGAARKELAQVRMAKKAHLASWQTFVEQVIQAVEQGQEDMDTKMTEFQEKEAAALTKVSVARKAIKELATKADAPMLGDRMW